jgi:hypothetical protein
MALSKIQSESINLADDFAGMHFGGTVSANQFDDYETGTWTPALDSNSSKPATLVTGNGNYTKIGELVFLQCQISNVNSAGYSGQAIISGMPFLPSETVACGNQMLYRGFDIDAGCKSITPYIAAPYDQIKFYQTRDVTTWQPVLHNPTSSVYAWFTAVYRTTA